MFKKIELRNFRTHAQTNLELYPMTLLIGNNNSGKSNFFSGIRHFSHLIRRARPDSEGDLQSPLDPSFEKKGSVQDTQDFKHLRHSDFFPFKYRLADKDDSMGFSCEWAHKLGVINYSIDLYEVDIPPDNVACREKIIIKLKYKKSKELKIGFDKTTTELALRTEIEISTDLGREEKELANNFFADMASVWAFHFQPSFLKQLPTGLRNFNTTQLRVPQQLGYEGGGLQQTLADAERLDKNILDRFMAALRRFEPSFFGIKVDRKGKTEKILWQFDLRRESKEILDEFHPMAVSDGLLKAAAISLLTSIQFPPSLILLEEIENGINPGNIQEFLNWLWQDVGLIDSTPRGPRTQCILTSHSPSVLREFADYLDYVYIMRLNRNNFKTITTNLNEALEALVSLGTVQGEIVEDGNRKFVKIPRHQLTELWYSGSIG